MRIFLSIKFWGDHRNQEEVRRIIGIIQDLGHEVFCVVEHAENWGEKTFTPKHLMSMTLNEIDKSDILVANVADWPIGVGVEAGYAYAKEIPVVCICSREQQLPNTISGIASSVIKYVDYAELKVKLIDSLAEHSRAADREDTAANA